MRSRWLFLALLLVGISALAQAQPAYVLGGYNASATTITFQAGNGAHLPSAPVTCDWWNITVCGPNPSCDPQDEKVLITFKSGDTAIVVRGYLSAAYPHNNPLDTYAMQAISSSTPIPTNTPTFTRTNTPTVTPTPTFTGSNTPTFTPTPTFTFTFTVTNTFTNTSTPAPITGAVTVIQASPATTPWVVIPWGTQTPSATPNATDIAKMIATVQIQLQAMQTLVPVEDVGQSPVSGAVTLANFGSVIIPVPPNYRTLEITNVNGAGQVQASDLSDLSNFSMPFYTWAQPLHNDPTFFLTQDLTTTEVTTNFGAYYFPVNGIKNILLDETAGHPITFNYSLNYQPLVNQIPPSQFKLQDWLEGFADNETSNYPGVKIQNAVTVILPTSTSTSTFTPTGSPTCTFTFTPTTTGTPYVVVTNQPTLYVIANASATPQVEVDDPVLRNDISIRQTNTQTPIPANVGFGVAGIKYVATGTITPMPSYLSSASGGTISVQSLGGTNGSTGVNALAVYAQTGLYNNTNQNESWRAVDGIGNTTTVGIAAIGNTLQDPAGNYKVEQSYAPSKTATPGHPWVENTNLDYLATIIPNQTGTPTFTPPGTLTPSNTPTNTPTYNLTATPTYTPTNSPTPLHVSYQVTPQVQIAGDASGNTSVAIRIYDPNSGLTAAVTNGVPGPTNVGLFVRSLTDMTNNTGTVSNWQTAKAQVNNPTFDNVGAVGPILRDAAGNFSSAMTAFSPAGTSTPGMTYGAHIVVDPTNNTIAANCVSITTNGVTGSEGLVTAAVLYAVTGTNSITRASFGNDNLPTQGANNANITTRSISEGYIWGNQNAYERWNGVDGIGNTGVAAGYGVAAMGIPSQNPSQTFIATGTGTPVTYKCSPTYWGLQVDLGNVSAATFQLLGSMDGGLNYPLTIGAVSITGTSAVTFPSGPVVTNTEVSLSGWTVSGTPTVTTYTSAK